MNHFYSDSDSTSRKNVSFSARTQLFWLRTENKWAHMIFFYNEHFLFWPVSESLDLFNQLSYSFNVSETKTEAGIWGFPMFSGLVGTCGSFRLQTKHQQKQHGRKLELVCLCQSHTERGVETRAPRLLKPATVTSDQNHSETKPPFSRQ